MYAHTHTLQSVYVCIYIYIWTLWNWFLKDPPLGEEKRVGTSYLIAIVPFCDSCDFFWLAGTWSQPTSPLTYVPFYSHGCQLRTSEPEVAWCRWFSSASSLATWHLASLLKDGYGEARSYAATSQPHDSLLHMISYVRTIGSLPVGETTGNMFCICFGTRQQQVQDLGDNCLVFITQ